METVSAFVGEPKKLNKPITDKEFARSVRKLNNNNAAGADRISAELVEYAPVEVHRFIREIPNDVLENHSDLDLGRGILVALQKPGITKSPIKNLRPNILLLIIRKILFNITRIKPYYESYLSHSQRAYRSSDVVWAHRWIVAKIQKSTPKFTLQVLKCHQRLIP